MTAIVLRVSKGKQLQNINLLAKLKGPYGSSSYCLVYCSFPFCRDFSVAGIGTQGGHMIAFLKKTLPPL